METKNYYGVMGLGADASDEEIKKTYRMLAMQYHPDRNGNNPGAVERLKELNEAYHVLGNRERKSVYDQSLRAWAYNPTFNSAPGGVDIDSFLQNFSIKPFGFGGRGRCKGMGRGRCGRGRWRR